MSKQKYSITSVTLQELYYTNHMSEAEIAKIYSCDETTISYYIHKYNIPIRRWSNIITKDALYQLYCVEQKNVVEIANIYNCSPPTIRTCLKKYNITTRGIRETQRIKYRKSISINTNLKAILDGLLLSDGTCDCFNGYQARYGQASSQKEFIDYVARLFDENGYSSRLSYRKMYLKITNKYYDAYELCSPRTIELKEVYNRWYPDGKKHVPADITLTPMTVLLWYLGDGFKVKRQRSIILCTHGFVFAEQELLISAFNKIGIIATIIPQKNKYYVIRISKNNFDTFISYMGQNPVSCYQYKFNN